MWPGRLLGAAVSLATGAVSLATGRWKTPGVAKPAPASEPGSGGGGGGGEEALTAGGSDRAGAAASEAPLYYGEQPSARAPIAASVPAPARPGPFGPATADPPPLP